MNYLLLLLSVILIAGLSVPVYAQTISDNVVINEIDTNPNGDDSLSISEWVELYNPTDSDIDLSGWEIASTTVLKKTLTIPDGTIISPDKFLTFTNTKIWFTDSGELVELRNSDGIVIDKTPTITDLQNNFLSWQRSYDGYSDWEFTLGSPGGSNGKFLDSGDSPLVTITLSSDKPSYLFDDTAIIQGTVSEKLFVETPTFQVTPIKINISGPDFYRAISLYPDDNLNYETTLDLVQVLGINSGNYEVSVNYGGVTNVTTFSVGFDVVEDDTPSESSFNLQIDKSEYFPGELILINAFTTNVVPLESMVFTITDSHNELIANGNLFPSDGTFSTSIFLTNVNPNYGEYVVNAEYSEFSAISTFTLVDPLLDVVVSDEVTSQSMNLKTDKSTYFINELITISGMITNFSNDRTLYAESVKLSFKDSNGDSPTFTSSIMDTSTGAQQIDFTLDAIVDDFGAFSVTTKVIPVLFSEGDYVLTASYSNLDSTSNFSIGTKSSIAKSENFEKFENGYLVSTIRTVIEKVNRISDNLISITSQEKIINEESVKPRVLSGSMVTVDKSDQSTVNLQVTSKSGICIIGQNSDCMITESTRKPGQIFEVVQVDGLNLNVRYSGPDVRLEKFSILPQSSEEFLPNSNWNVEVIKDKEISRFYYKITYKTLP